MRPVENGAWGSFVSYIVTECAGVAFYQNHVKCGRATQSEPQLCTSCGATVAKINMRRAEKKLVRFTSGFWQYW